MWQPGENPKGYWTSDLFPQQRWHAPGADEGDSEEGEKGEADILVLEIEIKRSGRNNNIIKRVKTKTIIMFWVLRERIRKRR